ncbi:MAG: nitroreductase family protein [Acidimicrobiia bacterium]
MDVWEAIHERRSVRRYTAEAVDDATVERLIEAAASAPSALNAQPWAFGIVRDRALLDRYAARVQAMYVADPPVAEFAAMPASVLGHLRELVSRPGYDVFHGAPVLITIYATAPGDVPDCYLAAENLLLAAYAAGLGTCPIGLARPLMDRAAVKDELGVPASLVAALPVIVGHPAEQPPVTTRRPVNVLYRR